METLPWFGLAGCHWSLSVLHTGSSGSAEHQAQHQVSAEPVLKEILLTLLTILTETGPSFCYYLPDLHLSQLGKQK